LPISIILGSSISLIDVLLIDILFTVIIIIQKDLSFIKDKGVKILFACIIQPIQKNFLRKIKINKFQ